MQQNRLLLSILVLAFTILSVGAFLDSPTPTLAQSVGSTTDLTENGIMGVVTTTTPLPTTTGTATVTVTATGTSTATVTATATGTVTATGTATTPTATTTASPTATGTPTSRDTYLALVQRAANTPTPTATPTVTPSPTPQPECNAYFDDFSNPNSGWPEETYEEVVIGYENNEYQVRSRVGGFIFQFYAPTPAYTNYALEADVRWNGTVGALIGLPFGIASNGNTVEFYAFELDVAQQAYAVIRYRTGSNPAIVVAPAQTSVINTGNAVNHLKITTTESQQIYEINGQVVATSNVSTPGARRVGFEAATLESVPEVDARFDNYCITVPTGTERGIVAPEAPLIPVPLSENGVWSANAN